MCGTCVPSAGATWMLCMPFSSTLWSPSAILYQRTSMTRCICSNLHRANFELWVSWRLGDPTTHRPPLVTSLTKLTLRPLWLLYTSTPLVTSLTKLTLPIPVTYRNNHMTVQILQHPMFFFRPNGNTCIDIMCIRLMSTPINRSAEVRKGALN